MLTPVFDKGQTNYFIQDYHIVKSVTAINRWVRSYLSNSVLFPTVKIQVKRYTLKIHEL